MTKNKTKIKILVYDDYNQLKSLVEDFSEAIEFVKAGDEDKLNLVSQTGLKETDVVVFDSAEDFSFNWKEADKMKEVNPGLKTIMFTSMKNRKFRRHYLSRGVDYFMFKETEGLLLKTIVKQIHSSKAKRTI